MNKTTQTIGKRIRTLRILKDMKQENIAAKLQLTAGAFAKIERGETDPSITRLYEIAAILKVDITVLLQDNTPSVKPAEALNLSQLTSQVNTLVKDMQKIKSELAGLKPVNTKKK